MYCPNCGQAIADEAVVCIGCGRPVTPIRQATQSLNPVDAGAKAVHILARSFLISGILNIIVGIIVTAIGWFLGLFSVLIGIIELVNAYIYWPIPPRSSSSPNFLPILEMINLIFGPVWSLIFGIGNRKILNSPGVKAYFAALQSGQPFSIDAGIPAVAASTSQAMPFLSPTKKCPSCGNSILIEAKICQFCRQEFTDESIQADRRQFEENVALKKASDQKRRKNSQGNTLRVIGVFVAIIGVLLLLMLVAGQLMGTDSKPAKDIGTLIGILLVCPTPLILLGIGLFFWGANILKKLRIENPAPAIM